MTYTAIASPAVESHDVKFFRKPHSRLWKAQCSCGWVWIDVEKVVQAKAATHDIDQWEEVTS